MSRNCGCSGSTCGCKVEAFDDSISVSGIGTKASPFKIGAANQPITNQIEVNDTDTLNLAMLGSGTLADPYIISGTASAETTQGSYDPTYNADFDAGTGGTVEASFVKSGKMVHAEIVVTFGTSPTIANGAIWFTLPAAFATVRPTGSIVGAAALTGLYSLVVAGANTDGAIRVLGAATGGLVGDLSATAPASIASGDTLVVELDYLGA